MEMKKDSLFFGKAEVPIISTLMEVDTYKFLMMYFVWKYAPLTRVTFAFTNRTKTVLLARQISIGRLREELAAAKRLRITQEIIVYLRAKGIFAEDFLADLAKIVLPEPQVSQKSDGQFEITVSGVWYEAMLWETIILAIVSQLYAESVIGYDGAFQQKVITEGERRLREKANILQATSIKFLQFGLRRRPSGWWERHVTEMALELMPQNMIAVSNVALANQLNVSWGGTNAHELYSGFEALRRSEDQEASRHAQYEVLEKWQALYPQNLRIMLPDTFGSKQFFQRLPREIAQNFRGARQDSGDPIVFGKVLLETYRRMNIESREKSLLFSDGLDVAKMMELQNIFSPAINVLFGWGTNFTNDTGFLKPISIVMKLVEANGNPAVKLSDNLAKAIGEPNAVATAKDIFGYSNTFTEECVY